MLNCDSVSNLTESGSRTGPHKRVVEHDGSGKGAKVCD